ncbi:MAG: sn-glycerol-3-phosphate ABC transporter ATP-binding protein UgpC [Desulfobacteraceae bacterium]|nr:MAG: sn-glycerol-3-phosphate ABC transporter ATP-binding protein UgpC [Desulfobacteraceae bacterium]
MANVSLRNLSKRFDDVIAVNKVNLEVSDREFVVLVGPSGCGKTTTLRMIAGLEEITEGDIYIGNRLINQMASKDRNIAMVFQSYALYPHMKVFDNMAFGLKMRKIPREERIRRVHEAAEILGIKNLLDRKPKQLSGGQRQRVALGRAIVRKPDVFLFDEPLSNLDAKLRVQMRTELIKLHNRLKSTSIYVTHDQVEAMTMGDRIVVMKDGLIQQVGSPLELYDKPANLFVAGFIGSPAMNFMECRLIEENGRFCVDTASFRICLPGDLAAKVQSSGLNAFIFGIRPENVVKNGAGDPSARKSGPLQAHINVVETLGKETYLDITVGNHTMTSIVPPSTRVSAGETILLEMNLDKIHLFDKESGTAIL